MLCKMFGADLKGSGEIWRLGMAYGIKRFKDITRETRLSVSIAAVCELLGYSKKSRC